MWMLLISPLIAFSLAVILTRLFSHPDSRWYILDHPNERSLHTKPTPRSGGVAIIVGILVGSILAAPLLGGATKHVPWLGAAVLIVALTSYIDDRTDLSPTLRLTTHFLAAVLLVLGGYASKQFGLPGITPPLPSEWALGFSVLFIVWMINLYNFMDGMDGFAGGMAVIGFGTLAAFGGITGHVEFFLLNSIVFGAALGFLLFNFPPARIFMGDVGSSSLGLLAAGMCLWGIGDGLFSFWQAVLLFSPFIVDASVTLGRRMIRRERVWQAHKTHYYQRLVELGWGHRRTVLWEYVLMIGCAASALASSYVSLLVQWTIAIMWVLAYFSMALIVGRLETARPKGV